MDNQKIAQVPVNTITRNLADFAAPTGNVYESVMIIAKRSNQIAADIKQELNHKLEEFSNYADTLEETFENREQIEISKYYERLPKPVLIATKEFQDGKIYYRKAE
ncbi:MAG: DNA-directed RNA polymerase subunit omega [Bacteroidales bacterium]|jgi:DNA-directed RNA polymerase subunit K/omega|nr:DNA-directed RNA polymerase subunit omega [Bacteroidales bacterium]MBQ1637510.1 DNA-directed RNA polymerase subunit omega [Bacteroidales bacterium]MBQ1680100.1 DNA-directed RNA polymerase subunit omega [Bacteroidales bacterium]MBQ1753618.1 DNA-directed RNA polymerase subunit omega [Bacteroidales bacterium]MBQ1831201.1 DNA-directed RNA polymerase subunit omega [Bacteroidales bacterium]